MQKGEAPAADVLSRYAVPARALSLRAISQSRSAIVGPESSALSTPRRSSLLSSAADSAVFRPRTGQLTISGSSAIFTPTGQPCLRHELINLRRHSISRIKSTTSGNKQSKEIGL